MMIRYCTVLIISFLLITIISCTAVPAKNNGSSGALIFVSNASPVDFDDLYEFHDELSSPVDKKVTRYEGFYDKYREGLYKIPMNQQNGICLSPEAEWMIFFPTETQNKIKLLMNDVVSWDKPKINNEFRNLKVDLRGMIEGKWLDVLKDESRKPKWIMASGGNNVVSKSNSSKQLVFTVKELDELLKHDNGRSVPKIEIYRVKNGMKPDVQKPIYYSNLNDLAKSDLIKVIIDGNREPVLAIMKAVLKKFQFLYGDKNEFDIIGINFSAKGDYAALVNNPARIQMARDTPFYKKGWFALRYFTIDQPRIGMRLITERAVSEQINCLANGEKYILYLYDERNENIGAASLSLKGE